jgi:hypothetical protein
MHKFAGIIVTVITSKTSDLDLHNPKNFTLKKKVSNFPAGDGKIAILFYSVGSVRIRIRIRIHRKGSVRFLDQEEPEKIGSVCATASWGPEQ